MPRDRKRPSGDFALVRNQGLETWVVSCHVDRGAAEKAMRKLGGEPDSMFTNGMRVVCVSPLVSSSASVELVDVMGRWSIRPRRP